jgi:hypothetical protein
MDYRRFRVRIYYPEFFERAVSDYCNGENGADDLDVGSKAHLSVLESLQDDRDKIYDEFEKESGTVEEEYTAQFLRSSFSKTITDKRSMALRYISDVNFKEVSQAEAVASHAGESKLAAWTYILSSNLNTVCCSRATF